MLLSVDKYLEMRQLNEELEEAVKDLSNKEYMKSLISDAEAVKSGKGKKARKLFKELGI